jgi:hypothetical protein
MILKAVFLLSITVFSYASNNENYLIDHGSSAPYELNYQPSEFERYLNRPLVEEEVERLSGNSLKPIYVTSDDLVRGQNADKISFSKTKTTTSQTGDTRFSPSAGISVASTMNQTGNRYRGVKVGSENDTVLGVYDQFGLSFNFDNQLSKPWESGVVLPNTLKVVSVFVLE